MSSLQFWSAQRVFQFDSTISPLSVARKHTSFAFDHPKLLQIKSIQALQGFRGRGAAADDLHRFQTAPTLFFSSVAFKQAVFSNNRLRPPYTSLVPLPHNGANLCPQLQRSETGPSLTRPRDPVTCNARYQLKRFP
jgi:hypothetical protein